MIEKVREQFEQLYQIELDLPEGLQPEYEIVSCLKYKEQKQVYLLRHKMTGKKAILKYGLGMYCNILREEWMRLLQLDGVGFPKGIYWEEQSDRCFLVREYVEGDTLGELTERGEGLGRQEALDAVVQVCMLLERLHLQKPPIIYRDIKPQNVVRTVQGAYVLIDLDTAREYKEGAEEDTVFMGTRGPASPEQFGYQQTDVRTDVYGVGMLLLYLLTGGYKKEALYNQPKRLVKLIETCTEFNPKDRYTSVAEVKKCIKELLKVKDLEKWESRNKKIRAAALVTAVVLLCAVVCGGVWFYKQKERPNVIEFANPKIEEVVRKRLYKPEGEILVEELEEVRSLIIVHDMVFDNWAEMENYKGNYWYELDDVELSPEKFDLSDLKYFTKLNTLVLEYQNIEELPELSHLPLTRVSFAHNEIEDVSALGKCKSLELLWISNNPIEDLSDLQGLDKLESLDVAFTGVDDLTPVISDTLESLYCNHTGVTDYAFLANCTGLKDVRVSDFTMTDAEYVAGLPGMEHLSFFDSKVNSLSVFREMKNLKGLELAGNKSLTSLEGIEYLTELSYLGLGGTSITALPENFSLERLNVLELTATGVTDFTPLRNCPRLQSLYVGEEMEEEAERQLQGSGIEVTGI